MTQFPVIHLNGTDGKVLQDEYAAAYDAVNNAITACLAVTCHGRDYYVIPAGDATAKAWAEHRSRIAKLEEVAAELSAIYADIFRQNQERAR